jgi:hypothetical protein
VAETKLTEVAETTESPFLETLKMAAYAPTGGRKTLQIGHLIETFGAENVGVISCEHGLNTIRSRVNEKYVRNVDSREGLRDAWAWARDNFNAPHQWLAVDGGTRVLNWVQQEIFGGAQAALEQIINGTNRRELPTDVRRFAPFVTKELDLNTQQMWIQTGFQCERLFDSFVKLGSNMYWTFWEERTSIDQYTKGPPAIPDTPGKGALGAVKGAFDFIFRLVSNGDNVTAQFRNAQGSNAIYGKTRDDWNGGFKVPNEIPQFNLGEFVKSIQQTTTTKEKAAA